MILKCYVLFCENEHGTGDVCWPDVTTLDGFDIQQMFIKGNTIGRVRREAKKAGWGRINGADYCPACMDSMRAE